MVINWLGFDMIWYDFFIMISFEGVLMMFNGESLFFDIMFDFEMSLLSGVSSVVSIQYGITNIVTILIGKSK